jgi:hypothetical protein
VTTELTELRPPATDDDDFIPWELEYDIPDGAVVASEALENVLRTLNSSSTSSPSGWNFHFIKTLYTRVHDSHRRANIIQAYTCFINHCLQRKLSTTVTQLWASSS